MTIDATHLTIAVVGSINIDIVARVGRFPKPGETLTDAALSLFPGGKGANQALAARRLGAEVYMLGCVGQDSSADEALANLAREGVKLDYLHRLPDVASGTALILVNEDGENQIVVAPGANHAFRPEHVTLPKADAIVAQLEVPTETLLEAARQKTGLFCLNAAPVRDLPDELLRLTDLLVVNEGEAQAIGEPLDSFPNWLAVTYGRRGAVLKRGGEIIAHQRPPKVNAIDTTGAGDAFTAALTIGIAAQASPDDALRYACAVGALTTTQLGAQASPSSAEVKNALA